MRQGLLDWMLIIPLGMLWIFAFTPDPQVLAAVPGLLGVLAGIERCRSTKQIFVLAVVFGGITIGYGYHWLAQTVQDFGDVPVVPSWLLTSLFGVVGTVHLVLFAVILRAFRNRARRPHPMFVAALWVFCEALPMRLFPWMIGHGAVNCPPLLQQAEWGGVSAVSFAMICLIAPIHEWLRWAFSADGERHRARAAALTFAVGLLLFGWGQWRYRSVLEQDEAASQTWRVAIVQPDVGSRDKRMEERDRRATERKSVGRFRTLSEQAVKEKAKLVVWPETAVTHAIRYMLPKFDPAVTNNMLSAARYGFIEQLGRETAFLIGSYEMIPTERRADRRREDWRYNIAALRQPGGRDAQWSVFRKVFLIPFGEYMPFGLMEDRLPQKFTMKPGADGQGPLVLDGKRLVPFLCYEGILPGHVRDVAGEHRADLLVSLTNDSWFGDSWEPHQHLNFTRFRAVEHRAPLVRSTNTGISAFVNAAGDVVSRMELYKHGILVHDVPFVDRERTLFAKVGYLFPWILAALALLGLIVGAFLGTKPGAPLPRADG